MIKHQVKAITRPKDLWVVPRHGRNIASKSSKQ